MASSLFGGVQKPNPLRSAMQAVNMMRNATRSRSCRRSTRYGRHYLSNSVKHLSHT
nr:MAG TPA: hypothetical protein [Caudoviricetes sp.]